MTSASRRSHRAPTLTEPPCSAKKMMGDPMTTGWTLLTDATNAGSVDCVSVLIERGGAKVNVQDRSGYSPLMIAAASGSRTRRICVSHGIQRTQP